MRLAKLRDLGNTLLVVEHDREVVEDADQLLDFGPAAGRYGGQIVARGTPAQVAKRRRRRSPGPTCRARRRLPCRRTGAWRGRARGQKREVAAGRSGMRTEEGAKAEGGRPGVPAGQASSGTRDLNARLLARGRQTCRPLRGGWLEIIGARHNNLKNIDVRIPLGTF